MIAKNSEIFSLGVKRIKIQWFLCIFAVQATFLPVNTHEPSQSYRTAVFDRTAKSFLIYKRRLASKKIWTLEIAKKKSIWNPPTETLIQCKSVGQTR